MSDYGQFWGYECFSVFNSYKNLFVTVSTVFVLLVTKIVPEVKLGAYSVLCF